MPGSTDATRLAFPTANDADVPQPLLAIDADPLHQFGTMSQQSKDTHEWVVTNDGEGDLILTGTQPSCSCTVVDPKPDEDILLKPGESHTVKVEWETRQYTGEFRKTAQILTNDPRRPAIEFVIEGRIEPPVLVLPTDGLIQAGSISNESPHTYKALLASADRPDVAISEISTSRPDLLDVSYAPLSKDELAQVRALAPTIDRGHCVTVTVKPSTNLGQFQDDVVIKTDHPLRDEVRLTIAGKVVGPITVTPNEGVRLSAVPSNEGQEGSALLWVRGQSETRFEVARAPAGTLVTIEPADASAGSSAKGRAYRLLLKVPAGQQPGVINDQILLDTDHPQASRVAVPVYIRILGQG